MDYIALLIIYHGVGKHAEFSVVFRDSLILVMSLEMSYPGLIKIKLNSRRLLTRLCELEMCLKKTNFLTDFKFL